jgi:hypothetical protein
VENGLNDLLFKEEFAKIYKKNDAVATYLIL